MNYRTQRGFSNFGLLLVILIAAGLGLVIFYYWQTMDSALESEQIEVTNPKATGILSQNISDWQTYVNPKYGYTIRFPSGWYLNQGEFAPPPPETVRLSTFQIPKPVVLTQYAEMTIGTIADETMETNDLISKGFIKKEITIDGIKAIKLTSPLTVEKGLYSAVYFSNDGINYNLKLSSTTKGQSKYYQTFELMLTTIKLPSASSQTSLKTHPLTLKRYFYMLSIG
jgi:hypothetical protein